ncbi:hypothetical protein F901_00880 [Acinetobacter dispersus]|nr:hypothetical protein F901_00880 [Acinetobacter dispersus]
MTSINILIGLFDCIDRFFRLLSSYFCHISEFKSVS